MFKPTLCIAAIAMLLTGTHANAQMPYNVTVLNETYTPLTGATKLNDTIWNTDEIFTIPIGFNFKMDTIERNRIFLEGGSSINSDTSTLFISGFSLADGNLADRGELTGSRSLSPIRYSITGTPGNRIFKLELFNAGFDDELNNYGTMNDSVDIQYWLYEGSNIVDLRYGPSKISYASTYFNGTGEPLVGYGKDIDTTGSGVIYVLVGDPASPTLDSVIVSGGGVVHTPSSLLFSYPSSGTVYRFTPKTMAVQDAPINVFRIYPTKFQNEVFVENEQHAGAVTYTVVSANGAATNIKGNLEQNKTAIDVSALPPGMYLLQLQSKTGSMVQKLVKE